MQVGLGVGAHEHGLLRPRPPGRAGEPDGAGDRDGLGAVVGVAAARAAAAPAARVACTSRARLPAAAEHGGGAVEDLGRRPVAAVELDHLGRRPPAVDVEEEAGVGAVPPVDRLLRVADRGHVVAVAAPRLEQAELERVHVLELVDEEVAEPPALRGRERLVLLEGPGDEGEQVVEVDQAAAALAVLVGGVDLGDHARARSAGLRPARAHGVDVVVRGDHAGLGPLDLGGQLGGHRALVLAGDRSAPARVRRRPLRSSRVSGRAALVGPAGAQRAPGHRVEGARGGVAAEAEAAQAVVELAGRLAGEGEGQHVARVGRRRWPPGGRSGG